MGDAPKYEVNSKMFGLLSYWNRVGPDGYPTEPVNAHGPYPLRCLAERAAQKATQ